MYYSVSNLVLAIGCLVVCLNYNTPPSGATFGRVVTAFVQSSSDTCTATVVFVLRREYAPKYALRSYFYLLPSMSAARASQTLLSFFGFEDDKPQVGSTVP